MRTYRLDRTDSPMVWLSRGQGDLGKSWYPIFADDTEGVISAGWNFIGWRFAGIDLRKFKHWEKWGVMACQFLHCTMTWKQFDKWNKQYPAVTFEHCTVTEDETV